MNGSKGPFAAVDTKGGLRTFAAVCMSDRYADLASFLFGCANGRFGVV